MPVLLLDVIWDIRISPFDVPAGTGAVTVCPQVPVTDTPTGSTVGSKASMLTVTPIPRVAVGETVKLCTPVAEDDDSCREMTLEYDQLVEFTAATCENPPGLVIVGVQPSSRKAVIHRSSKSSALVGVVEGVPTVPTLVPVLLVAMTGVAPVL